MLDICPSDAFHSDALTVGNRLLAAVRQRICWIFVDDTVFALDMNNAAATWPKWILSEIVIGRGFRHQRRIYQSMNHPLEDQGRSLSP